MAEAVPVVLHGADEPWCIAMSRAFVGQIERRPDRLDFSLPGPFLQFARE